MCFAMEMMAILKAILVPPVKNCVPQLLGIGMRVNAKKDIQVSFIEVCNQER